jgi:hypothetical protein
MAADVVSREFSEELGGCQIVQGSQPGAIVIVDEAVEVSIAFSMVNKAAVMGGAVLWHAAQMLAKPAVEALDHAVGLWPERPGETVGDGARGAEPVKGMGARGFVVGLGFFVDGEAVGELGAVVGQDGVDGEGKAVEKALEKSGGGGGAAIGEDFEIDRDIGIAAAARPSGGRYLTSIWMKPAGASVWKAKAGACWGVRRAERLWRLRQRWMPLRDSCGLMQRRIASTMSSSGSARLRRSSRIRASSQSLIVVTKRCGRVERSVTSGRARQRATVRRWMPSSRASVSVEAVLFWI